MQLRLLGIVISFIFLGGLYYAVFNSGSLSHETPDRSPCQEPLSYTIGSVDPRFEITGPELKDIMREVELIWETPINRELLQYRENGSVAIHLIYGQEQKRTEKEQRLSRRIQTLKNRISVLRKEYQRYSTKYKERSASLDKSLSKYNKAISRYNKYLEKWRSEGGIPKSKEQEVKRRKRRINRLKSTFERKKKNTETARQQANAKSKQLNKLIDRRNSLVADYRSRFGEARKFDQGQYVKQGQEERINVYQFGNRAELKTVLAHESGHALGLEHVKNPESVMHAIMEKQDIFNLSLSSEDIRAIRKRCGR